MKYEITLKPLYLTKLSEKYLIKFNIQYTHKVIDDNNMPEIFLIENSISQFKALKNKKIEIENR